MANNMAQEQVTQAKDDIAFIRAIADCAVHHGKIVLGVATARDICGCLDRLASTTAQAEAAEKMAEALRELEAANERLWAERSAATYACMIEQDDSEAALLRLEEACSAAREALSTWESIKENEHGR